jgi:hypothetical protein
MSIQTLRLRLASFFTSKPGLWLLVIGAVILWLWSDSWCPALYWTVMAAFEYAVVAYLMRVCAGCGCMIYDEFHKNGVLRAVYLAAAVLVLLAFGFYFISISLKPGFPFYAFTLCRGRGACMVFIGSVLYGFFVEKRKHARHA